ncbi:MAG: hypothetical protein ACRYFS_14020 [Janthinobacterium lividum]
MQPGYRANTEQPSRNEWIECPKCRSVMLLLTEYEVQSNSGFPGVETELWEFLVFGWMAFVYNFAIGLLGFGGQKAKLAKKKKELLPAFPNGLVCPRCFFVQTRF